MLNALHRLIDFFINKKILGILAVLIFFVCLGISTVYRGGLGKTKRTDVTVFLAAAKAIPENQNLYDIQNERNWNYCYFPLFATLFLAFYKLPLPVVVFLWYLLGWAALLGSLYLGYRQGARSKEDLWKIILAALLCLPVILPTFSRGQLGIIVLFLLMAVFSLYMKGKDLLAGFLLGFTIVLKTSPAAALLFYFLLKREWKVCVGIAVGLVFFLFLWPSLFLGFGRNWELLKAYHLVMQFATSDLAYRSQLWHQLLTPFASDNQSIYSVVSRLYWGNEKNLIEHSNAVIRWGVNGIGAAMMLFLGFIGKRREKANGTRLFAEYALFSMIMLFISPATETHHFTVIFMVFLAGFYFLESIPEDRLWRSMISGSIFTAAFSIIAGMVSDDLNYIGVFLAGSLICWGVFALFLFRGAETQR